MVQNVKHPSAPGEIPVHDNSNGHTHPSPPRDFSLSDRYTREDGLILLSGIQALARVPLDQRRADVQRGLNTATFISGYRGSPVGGLDMELEREVKLMRENHVVFMPGLNEDLGATAVFGSQIANLFPNPRYDGVLGMWYGKAPGLDRSGDAIKHANFAGVGKYGGVLAVAGDDPNAKSSTLPSATEIALYDAMMPVLFPGNVQEVLDYGRYGFELSRYSGLWVGFKIVTNVADEFSTAMVSPDRVQIHDPGFIYQGRPWHPNQNTNLITPFSLAIEREVFDGRLEAARLFGVTHNLNPVTVSSGDDWLGIIAPGKTYYDVRQVLWEIGVDDDTLQRYGVRLMKVGLMSPMDRDSIRTFARGLEEIFVIEEKRPFIELFVRSALYNLPERPRVIGKRDENDAPVLPLHGQLDADTLVRVIVKRLEQKITDENLHTRIRQLDTPSLPMTIPLLARTPYYCSGCPHNTSTINIPAGSIVGAGIGCHTMTLLMDTEKNQTSGITQMGGEGVQWVGASPFSDTQHIFQNLGDGTMFHSGTLAIRQAVAAKNTNITYKILWNSAVAMTGGQAPESEMTIWRLTHLLKAEGVGRIIVTTPNPRNGYPPEADWADGVQLWHRDRIEEAQIALRETPGVTVLIHDQECAAELRRKRRRKLVEEPPLRVVINEAVCEGCGDCGEKSNCLSVFPVETEMGRKTQIHQSSCNKDYSCLKGHCPAFLTIIPNDEEVKRSKPFYTVDVELPEPQTLTGDIANLFMMGIGGTGVVTVNQIVATAAVIDGKYITSLDQTGLSQKGGPVVSHIKIMNTQHDIANKLSAGTADAYIVFDVLTGADHRNLAKADKSRTVAVVSTSEVPTGSMVSSKEVGFPSQYALHRAIDDCTRADVNVYLDAIGLSEALFGSHMPANLMMIGAAYQRGLIPISASAIERAIELNGVAVKANIQAFRVGRRIVIDPDWVQTLKVTRAGDLDYTAPLTAPAKAIIDSVGAPADSELRRLLDIRVPELIAYQNEKYAQTYADFVRQTLTREQAISSTETRLSEAVARYLYKLMAYKDEYEVARLHTKSNFKKELATQFGQSASYSYMLFPPVLRVFGLNRKVKLGKWFEPFFNMLTRMKGLRGTPLDVFGYDEVRRTERQLPAEYRAMMSKALEQLTPETYERAVELATLPDIVRGYDHIKLENVKRYRAEIARLQG